MMKNGSAVLVLLGALFVSPLQGQAQTAPTPPILGMTCTACHGPGGKSQGPIPSLAGLPAEHIASAMKAFKSGERPATLMDRIAKGYTDEEIEAMAKYFAEIK